VNVLIRPDDILHDDDSTMTAVVRKKAFRGAEFLYTLALDSGTQLLSLVPSHHNHPVNEAIGIRLEIDHLVVFPLEA
jgi:iron(III) transport system ATP-binding protein